MKTRHLAFICLSLSAVVAMAANDAASGQKLRNDPPSPVEYLAHIPRLQYVNAILISPDGGTVATLRGENTSWNEGGKPLALQVRSVPGGDLVWTARSPVFRLLTFSSLAFSLDGRWLAAAIGTHDGKGEVRLWDVASGELKRMVTDLDLGAMSVVGWESQVAFSPEGTILAIAGDNQTINLWSTADDKWRGSFGPGDPPDPGRCVMQFVRDGLLLAGVNWFQQVEVKLWSYPGK
jgi:WD40 repeat protein